MGCDNRDGENVAPKSEAEVEDHDSCSSQWLPCLCVTYLGYSAAREQESREERLLRVVPSLLNPPVIALRGGKPLVVHARELVVGDVVTLVAGDKVPADMRLVQVDRALALKCVDGYVNAAPLNF